MEQWSQQLSAEAPQSCTLGDLTITWRAPGSACHSAGDVLVFRIGGQHYSVPAAVAQAVFPLRHYTPLPFIHPCIVGTMPHEGGLLGILDIRPMVGLPRPPIAANALILVVQLEGRAVGFLVDAVLSGVAGKIAAPGGFDAARR